MRTAGERVAGHPAAHPRPVDVAVAIIAGIPLGTPQPASSGKVVRRGHSSFLAEQGRRVEARGERPLANEIMTAMSTRTMRAYVLTRPRQGEVQEVPPPMAAPGEVVVDVERIGVCGTDIEFFTGDMPGGSRSGAR
jgi:hypothetical protein